MSTRYTETHEWIRPESDGSLTIGITHYAQEHLGDIVFVDLPDVGSQINAGESAVVIESVKAAADIYVPVSGEVVATNESLGDAPETVNKDPLEAGWFLRLRPAADADISALMDEAAYKKLTGQ